MILVVSNDADFSGTLAEQIGLELKLECKIAAPEDAKGLMDKASLIVTSETAQAGKAPVIAVKTKPLRLQSLLADISARIAAAGGDMALGPDCRFSSRQKQLLHSSGQSAALTDKETQLVQTLVKAGREGIAKDALLKAVWGIEQDMDTHTLETHIYRLRAKFRELSAGDRIVATKNGYRLELS